MNTDIQSIQTATLCGQEFTIYGTPTDPLFLAKDVAEVIDHQNITHLVGLVDEDEKLTYTICKSGQNREMWFLTEQGLYEVLMQSRKPIAKQFKKGVKAILKEIRTKGGYLSTTATDTPETIMAKAVLLAQEKITEQAKQLEQTSETLQAQSQLLSEQAPKVAFADAILASKNSCLVGELAKLITQNGFVIGQNRLFQWMRDRGYLAKRGASYNLPTQAYVEQGLFEVKRSTRSGSGGELYSISTTKVTPKGQEYFIRKFINFKNKESEKK